MEHVTFNAITGEEISRVSFTAEEIAEVQAAGQISLLQNLRSRRNQLLAETDYLGLPDLGGFSAEMTAYRQALRDLPANTSDPANVVWPTKPEVN